METQAHIGLLYFVKEIKLLKKNYMAAGKKLTDFTSLFSSYDFEKNEDLILSYFKVE